MIIKNIHISNFRNIKRKSLIFSPKTTIIVGPNASGKTNILECLFLLSTGKSFRARVEEEMISYRQEISRIKGRIFADKEKTDLEVILTRGEITIGEDPEKTEKVPKKKLLVNGVSRHLYNFAGNFKVVLFGPQHLELVIESPSRRRDFLDTVLSQVDREYRRASLSYEKGLKQRNRLLYRIREEMPVERHGVVSKSQLAFWDKLLIRNGDYLSTKREDFFSFVNETGKLNDQEFSLEYDKSAISESRLEQYAEEEIAAATTLVGPHRDDFCFRLKKNKRTRDLSRYGSRGEQRMGVLWLKLAELYYIEVKTGVKPTLLLDDIFSELDHEHREVVMKTVVGQQTHSTRVSTELSRMSSGQAIITTADPHFVEPLKSVEIIKI